MVEVTTETEWQQEAEQAHGNYLIFKHSTTCPISARAYQEVSEFAKEDKLPIVLVKVIESRPLSQHMAGALTVVHASPQVILVKDNRPVWNTSHYDITKVRIEEEIGRHLKA